MADIHVDVDEIARGATRMAAKLADISKELGDLETAVSGLLQDGLVFEKASPALTEAYNTFSAQMKSSAKNIDSYGQNFREIAKSLTDSDENLTIDIRKAIDKMQADAAAQKK